MFFPLQIKNIKKQTLESVSIEFLIPNELKSTFSFQPGQYVNIKALIDGKEVQRSYSICAAPSSGIIEVGIKQITNGVFSTYANQVLKIGDQLEVSEPKGTFTIDPDPSNKKEYSFFAAGSGITPILSMITTVLEQETDSKINLFFGNKSPEKTMFKDVLETLSKNHPNRLNIFSFFSETAPSDATFKGRISADKIKTLGKGKFLKKSKVNFGLSKGFYLCGPEEMINEISSVLKKEFNVFPDQIHFELFFKNVEKKGETVSSSSTNKVIATLDGQEITFEVKENQTILEAGISAGYDLPFSCQGGLCCACQCAVISGETEMGQVVGLSEDEIAAGFRLACQTEAKSEEVKISFDF